MVVQQQHHHRFAGVQGSPLGAAGVLYLWTPDFLPPTCTCINQPPTTVWIRLRVTSKGWYCAWLCLVAVMGLVGGSVWVARVPRIGLQLVALGVPVFRA